LDSLHILSSNAICCAGWGSFDPAPMRRGSDDCDAINLDIEWPREARNAQKDARWRFLREIARINVVEPAEVGRIRAIDIALDHPLHGRPGGLQAPLHLVKDDFGLLLERESSSLAAGGVKWGQTGNEDEIARDNDRKDWSLAATLQIRRKRLYPNRSAFHILSLNAFVIGWTPIIRAV